MTPLVRLTRMDSSRLSKAHGLSLPRRDVLRLGTGVALATAVPALLGCGTPPPAAAASSAANAKPGVCGGPTHDQIEGPYYRPDAPLRAVLVEPGAVGVALVIEGRVLGADCARGLEGVELDVWHADHAGHYDNDGTMKLPRGAMVLRGKVLTDKEGRYRVSTIVPGRYLNGRQYRPSHVHVKLRGRGVKELTTQLYFAGDPYNDVDPFIHPSLVMPTEKTAKEWRSTFDFVLV